MRNLALIIPLPVTMLPLELENWATVMFIVATVSPFVKDRAISFNSLSVLSQKQVKRTEPKLKFIFKTLRTDYITAAFRLNINIYSLF